MSTHPGFAALQRVIKKSNPPTDGVLALMYIEERLSVLERLVADRNKAFVPPKPQEVTEYAKSINFALDGSTFCDFYEARNWCIGKVKMKSWKACVRTWKSRRNDEPQRPASRMPDNLRNDHGL